MTDTSLEAAAPAPGVRVIRPVKRRVRLSELWSTFPVARMLGLRDMKVKYKQAALGPVWLIVGPLGMLAAITIAFSGVTSVETGGVPYLLFAMAGLTVWTFIQLSASLGMMAIVGNAALVRRSPIPRVALITGSMIGNMPPVGMMFTLSLIATIIVRGLPLQALLLPVLALWLFAFTLSVSLILGAVTARFRDINTVMPLFIQAGIFVTPVGYSLQGSPKNIHTLLTVNPASGLIEAWRWAMFGTPGTDWTVIIVAVGWTVALLAISWRVFGRQEVYFADFV
jgi:ABC-type polysaccharide/polyol phosphate export permease